MRFPSQVSRSGARVCARARVNDGRTPTDCAQVLTDLASEVMQIYTPEVEVPPRLRESAVYTRAGLARCFSTIPLVTLWGVEGSRKGTAGAHESLEERRFVLPMRAVRTIRALRSKVRLARLHTATTSMRSDIAVETRCVLLLSGYSATQFFERCGPIADPYYHNEKDVEERTGFDVEGQLLSITKAVIATAAVLLHPLSETA